MDLEFSSSKLETASVNVSEANRLFGVSVGRKFIQRVTILKMVDNFSQLYGHRALRLHKLKGTRDDQYAIALTANYRLVITRVNEEKVCIISVEDYHGN